MSLISYRPPPTKKTTYLLFDNGTIEEATDALYHTTDWVRAWWCTPTRCFAERDVRCPCERIFVECECGNIQECRR